MSVAGGTVRWKESAIDSANDCVPPIRYWRHGATQTQTHTHTDTQASGTTYIVCVHALQWFGCMKLQ